MIDRELGYMKDICDIQYICINNMICIIEYSTNYIVILIFDILKDDRNKKYGSGNSGATTRE